MYQHDKDVESPADVDRRHFLSTMAAAAVMPWLGTELAVAAERPATAQKFDRKLKLGVIGCGSRGNWIMRLFQKHGGYEIHALADYFPEAVDKSGDALGVDKSRRFAGLSGYKKLLASGVDAVAIEDVPYFYPEQAQAAVDTGVHVYIAKPVAVDVPGTLAIGEAGKAATRKNLCFLVDYQLPTDPAVIEVNQRVRGGVLGRIAHAVSIGFGWQGWPDPPLGKTIESRLRGEIWLSDTALSGDTIVSYDIHIIDELLCALGERPVAATGRSRTCRRDPHGDRTDAATVIYELDDGVLWTHATQSITNNFDLTTLSASIFGMAATAHIQYGGKVYVRGGPKHYVGQVGGVFGEGVERNIASFYRNITEGHFENPTVQRAVDGTLTAILGREAAARRCWLTIDQLIKENKRLTADLSGLKS
jgi:predicted dehydrogenase